MNKFSKSATLALIAALVGFSCTANTVAQDETEAQRRESRIHQQDQYFSPDDLRPNVNRGEEWAGWPFFLFSDLADTPTQNEYPRNLLPTQDEQRLRTVRTEESLRTEGSLRPQQHETGQGQVIQGQAFREGIVLQTEQRQQAREVIIEPRQTRGELATGNAGTEYFQQEQIEHFVAPLENSNLVDGGTIVQQGNVRQIQVIEGRQVDGQRVIKGHQFVEGRRFVDGQPQFEGQPQIEGQQRIQGQRVIERPQVVEGQLPVQAQRVFESTEQIQQQPQPERRVTEQRVETRVQPRTQETRGKGIANQTNRETKTLETENLGSVPPVFTSNPFEKEEGQAAAVAPLKNQRGQQAQGQTTQGAIAQQSTTRRSQRGSRKAGAYWVFLPLLLVPCLCWAAWRFISSFKPEKRVTKTRSTTGQSTTRTRATAKTNKSQQRQSRKLVESKVSDRQQTTRSENVQREDNVQRDNSRLNVASQEANQPLRISEESLDRSEQTVRSETRSERPVRTEQTVRLEEERTERESRDRSEQTARSETPSERTEWTEQTLRSQEERTERESRDRSEQTARSETPSERPERTEQTVRSEEERTQRESRDRSELTAHSDRSETSSRQQRELSREIEAEATDYELNAQQGRQGAQPESKNEQSRWSNRDDRNSSDETDRETAASTAEGRDDFTRIEGVTEEAQRALYSSGFYRYGDLQKVNKKQLKRFFANRNLNVTDAQAKSWIVQARSLVSQWESNEQSVQQSQFNTGDSDARRSEEQASRNLSSQRDDLTKIRGIGKVTAELLSRSGITSYRDLYEAGPQRLRQLLAQAGPKFKLMDPSSWSQQASFAMNADWDGLKGWQSESADASSTQVSHDYSSMAPDDLTAIRGIGPATQKILREKGIHRFEQIATMKSEQFEELFAEYQEKFNLLDPSTWAEQAQAMLGDRTGDNEQENELMNEIQSIAEMVKKQPSETPRHSDHTRQS